MTVLARAAAIACAAALCAACSSPATSAPTSPRPDPGPSSAAPAAAPATTAEATTRATTGAPTTVPDDVALPHQWTWPAPATTAGGQPLAPFCLDPGPALRPPPTTDLVVRRLDGRRASRSESLGVYAGAGAAHAALRAWRGQAAACTGPDRLDEAGGRYDWSVSTVGVRGAHEAWLAHEAGADARLVSSVVVARVGNALYAESTRRAPGPGGATRRWDAEVASVGEVVPVLRPFRR